MITQSDMDKREYHRKRIDKIMSLPQGPERWRRTVNYWLEVNPVRIYEQEDGSELLLSARAENKDIMRQDAEYRATLNNDFGTSGDKNSAFRPTMGWPPALWEFFDNLNPQILKSDKHAKQLWETFPEYRKSKRY